MKIFKGNIDEEVKQTLSAFDGIGQASPKPYFFTRLSAKMQDSPLVNAGILLSNSLWIKVIVSVVIFLILVNAYTVSTVKKADTASLQPPSLNELQAFIGEYYPQTPTVYNLDTVISK
jgi:hypothetical protein